MNLIDHDGGRLAPSEFRGCRQPPLGPLLEQIPDPFARVGVFRRLLDFLVAAEHEDRHPPILVGDVRDLDADARVFTHPGDLLTDRGESVEAFPVGIKREMNWHNVRLLSVGTCQMPERRSFQELNALLGIQLANQHPWVPQVSGVLIGRRANAGVANVDTLHVHNTPPREDGVTKRESHASGKGTPRTSRAPNLVRLHIPLLSNHAVGDHAPRDPSPVGARDELLTLKSAMAASIIGQEATIARALLALLAEGHLLVEGPPGLAKTRAIVEGRG